MKTMSNMFGIKSKSIIDALCWDDYDLASRPANVFSCTEIIDAPKYQVLKRRYMQDVTTDVSDNFHLLDGSAVHYAVEMSNKAKSRERLSEERIFIRLPAETKKAWTAHTLAQDGEIIDQAWYSASDMYVSVKFDAYEHDEATIEDYKRCSVWEVIFGLKDSRVQQLNIGALGLKFLGFPVNLLRACLLLKDWSNTALKQAEQKEASMGITSKYPKIPYAEFEMTPWTEEDAKAYIRERVALHSFAHMAGDDDIPLCTADERWYKEGAYAVYKNDNKRADKLFNAGEDVTEAQAEIAAHQYADQMTEESASAKKKATYRVEYRPGVDTRCAGDKAYCACRQYCSYWKERYMNAADSVEQEGY